MEDDQTFFGSGDLFFGKKVSYWLELQKQARELGVVDYIQEIAELRGKVSFYESRIEQMSQFKEKTNK